MLAVCYSWNQCDGVAGCLQLGIGELLFHIITLAADTFELQRLLQTTEPNKPIENTKKHSRNCNQKVQKKTVSTEYLVCVLLGLADLCLQPCHIVLALLTDPVHSNFSGCVPKPDMAQLGGKAALLTLLRILGS